MGSLLSLGMGTSADGEHPAEKSKEMTAASAIDENLFRLIQSPPFIL